MIANAFTCTGPYALLIMLGLKRVENRSVAPEPRQGRCAIGCSKSFCKEEYGNFVQWASQALPEEDFDLIPAWSDVKDWPGKIVGACDYSTRGRDDLVLEADSRSCACARQESWDEGYPYWWDLSEVVCFDLPIPCRGNVGMWPLSRDLARRVAAADVLARSVGTKISTADDARRIFDAAVPIAGRMEGFFVLPLDAGMRTLSAPVLVSLGTTPGTTVVRPQDVFAEAFKANAHAIIVAHNHPSGDATPSVQDRQLTAELARLGDALGTKVLDHLILTGASRGASGIIRTVLFALLLPVVAWAGGGGYTNHAGNVVAGWPVKLTAREVELAVPPAKTGEIYPLSIFPLSEQRRLAADFGTPRVPPAVKRAVDGAKKAMARSRKRAEKGLCTKEESEAFCAKSAAALQGYLDGQVRSGAISPAERQALLP